MINVMVVDIQLVRLKLIQSIIKKGVYCPHCFDKRTDDQKKRSLMRQKQILLNKEKLSKIFLLKID